MLGWFLYFSIAKYVGFVMLSIFSSLYDLAEGRDNFLMMLLNKLLNVIAISLSLFKICPFSLKLVVSLCGSLFEKSGFTVCQNFLLSVIEFTSKFAK